MLARRAIRVGLLTALVTALPGSAVATGSAAAGPGCPQRAPAVPTHQSWAAARTTLAPAGATFAQVCRYSGLNAHPRLDLTAGALIRARAKVDRIVRRLDRLPAGPAGPVACPSDDLSQIRVVLGYRGGRVVRVRVGLSGCETVSNGAVVRTTVGFGRPGAGPALLDLLQRLLG